MNKIRSNTRTTKLRHVSKFMKSKNYILITDVDATLRLEAGDDMNSLLKLASQRAALERFKDIVVETITQLERDMSSPGTKKKTSTKIPVKQSKSSAKKINVRKK